MNTQVASRPNLLRPLIAFLLAFIVPIGCLAIWIFNFSSKTIQLNEEDSDPDFPNALALKSAKDYVRFRSDLDLQPLSGKDFNLAIWFRLLKPLTGRDRSFLVLKYDKNAPKRQGYALALTPDGEKIRPVVYWGSTDSAGTWYNFESFELNTHKWYVLVLSFINGRYLGLHIVENGQNSTQKLLGGYRFDQPIYAISDSDLYIGSFGKGPQLRARMGAFAISHIEKLEERLPELLAHIDASRNAKEVLNDKGKFNPTLFIDDFVEVDQELKDRIVKFPDSSKRIKKTAKNKLLNVG